jgi:hypothetical protein
MNVLGLLGVFDVYVQRVDANAHVVLLFAQHMVVRRAEFRKGRKDVQ